MANNLIEHVVRVLCKLDRLDPDEDPNYIDGKVYTSMAHLPEARLWWRYREKAKTAIEAIQSYKHTVDIHTTITGAEHPDVNPFTGEPLPTKTSDDYLREGSTVGAQPEKATSPAKAVPEATENHLKQIAAEISCGCNPCRGQCESVEAKALYFDEAGELARDALATVPKDLK